MSVMISVEDALSRLLSGVQPIGEELCALGDVQGRIAARDIISEIDQPPFSASAMDGYAVRYVDACKVGAVLRVIDEAPAGSPASRRVEAGTAIRVFTGSLMPEGSDHVIIQEDTRRDADSVIVTQAQTEPRNIRRAGLDFTAGTRLIWRGQVFGWAEGSVLAAANMTGASVYRRPKVGLFTNGDELGEPGETLSPGQIVNSSHYGLSALLRSWGAQPIYLGRADDNIDSLKAVFESGSDCDVITAIGGASVGDYDFVKTAAKESGAVISFEKVAVRPGKPTWHARRKIYGIEQLILGLPGNPASSFVTARLFLRPLIDALSGRAKDEVNNPERHMAILGEDISANGPREHYMRAQIHEQGGQRIAMAVRGQDSSRMMPFTGRSALIKRAPHAPKLSAGSPVDVLMMLRGQES